MATVWVQKGTTTLPKRVATEVANWTAGPVLDGRIGALHPCASKHARQNRRWGAESGLLSSSMKYRSQGQRPLFQKLVKGNVVRGWLSNPVRHSGSLPTKDVRWQGWCSREERTGYVHRSNRRKVSQQAAGTGDTSGPSSESTSTSGNNPQPYDVELEFEKWEREELAAILRQDKEVSFDARRSDPWASDPALESGPSTTGEMRAPGEVSSEAASVLGASEAGASFPVTPSSFSAQESGSMEGPIKVAVPAQDHSGTGVEVLALLSEVERKKVFEIAQAKQTWWGAFVYETRSLLLFMFDWVRTAAFASFHFLVKQPGELFNLSWPTPPETLSTMGLVTGTIAVLLVLISTMDTGFTFILASLVRRSAK